MEARTKRWIVIGGVLLGSGVLCCVSIGAVVWNWSQTSPALEGDADEPFPLERVAVPELPPLGEGVEMVDGVRRHAVVLGGDARTPGSGALLWIYVPAGLADDARVPCVLIAPAGTNLLTGMDLGPGDVPEHLPYALAGMVVVAFGLDGPDLSTTDDVAPEAVRAFRAAMGGLVNARNAHRYALERIPQVDADRVFVAGHSSAGRVALLYAAHAENVAGVIAFAPAYRTALPPMALRVLSLAAEGLPTFLHRTDPETHITRITAPTFLFHGTADDVVPVAQTQAFAKKLGARGVDVDLRLQVDGDHYQAMVDAGIPQAITWIRERAPAPPEPTREADDG